MKLEVLISVMNSNYKKVIKDMNVNTNAVIINQCKENSVEYYKENGKRIKVLSNDNIGVGRSRNLALLNASADICLIADDDMIYVDNYEEIILKEFKNNPNADLIIFNVESLNPERSSDLDTVDHRVTKTNYMRYGAYRVAFRREKIISKNIFFSLMFGGGAKYGSGEDTLFLHDCLKAGLYVHASTKKIADVKQEDSTWFKGFNEKYYSDKGALFAAMGKKLSIIIIPIMAYKGKLNYEGKFSIMNVIKLMYKGRKKYLYLDTDK